MFLVLSTSSFGIQGNDMPGMPTVIGSLFDAGQAVGELV